MHFTRKNDDKKLDDNEATIAMTAAVNNTNNNKTMSDILLTIKMKTKYVVVAIMIYAVIVSTLLNGNTTKKIVISLDNTDNQNELSNTNLFGVVVVNTITSSNDSKQIVDNNTDNPSEVEIVSDVTQQKDDLKVLDINKNDNEVLTLSDVTQQKEDSKVLDNLNNDEHSKYIFDLSKARQLYNTNSDTIPLGIQSTKDSSYFRKLQNDIDIMDHESRCKRYGWTYDGKKPITKRRIFVGALIANEPWELFEIVATEVYGIYTGMVFVEGNRTQNQTPRKFQRLNHSHIIKQLFGVELVQIRAHVSEGQHLSGLSREHEQRAEIIKGWKELGMKPDDVGIITDSDEVFTRDFLNAIQICDDIKFLDYNKHYCHHNWIKIIAVTRVYETSPECITADREWYHPDIIIGHCIDGIADNNTIHKSAPREYNSFVRAPGYGEGCANQELNKITDNSYPLWNAADFRRACGGKMINLKTSISKEKRRSIPTPEERINLYDQFTAYHIHNFFNNMNATRFKYKTYGHPDHNVDKKRIGDMSNDLKMMYNCIMDIPDDKNQKWKRVIGGFNATYPFYPLYFQDINYRNRRHKYVKQIVTDDENRMTMNDQTSG